MINSGKALATDLRRKTQIRIKAYLCHRRESVANLFPNYSARSSGGRVVAKSDAKRVA
jgi:hypothetical protein